MAHEMTADEDAAIKRLVKRGQEVTREQTLLRQPAFVDGRGAKLGASIRRAYEGADRIAELARKLR